MSVDEWLARVFGSVGTEIYPIDATDTECAPHVLQAWSDFADASGDPRCQAMASYILMVNANEVPHVLAMMTGLNTRGCKGTATMEQIEDAEEALAILRKRTEARQ